MKNKENKQSRKINQKVALFIVWMIDIILIFYLPNFIYLGVCFSIHLLITFLLKIKLKKIIVFFAYLLPFIFLTAFFNGVTLNMQKAIFITIRLCLVCYASYIFTQCFSHLEIGMVIQKLLKPLCIFHINTESIGLIICIAISFIPIMKREIENNILALKAKGFQINLIHLITKSYLIFNPIFASLFRRINEIELAFKVKAYLP